MTTSSDSLFVRSFAGWNADQTQVLGQVATPAGSQVIPVASAGGQPDVVSELALSPDGRRLLSTRPDGNGRSSLWVQPVDQSSTPVRLWSAGEPLGRPAWSPDGSRIAINTRPTRQDLPTQLFLVPATGGGAVLVGDDLQSPTWSPDARTIIAQDYWSFGRSELVRVDAVAGGARRGFVAGTAGASSPALSADGRWIAYTAYREGRVRAYVQPLGSGQARALSTIYNPTALSWSPGGSGLAVLWTAPYGDPQISLVSVDANGVPASPTDLMPVPHRIIGTMAWQGPAVTIRPTPALLGSTFSVSLSAASLSSGYQLSCTLDSRTPVLCGSTFHATGVVAGTHLLRVRAVERSGRVTVAARQLQVSTTSPTVRLTEPSVAVSRAGELVARYAATDPDGVASYDVRYRRATTRTPFGTYQQPWTWTATRSSSVHLTPSRGAEYCFSARARDRLGNVSGWTTERCASRPLDDRSLTASARKWTRRGVGSAYADTVTSTRRHGASASRRGVQARQVFLVATRCKNCGKVSVYVGGTRLGAVNLRASKTRRQVVTALPRSSSLRSGTLRVVVTSPSGRLVEIDGIGVRRS